MKILVPEGPPCINCGHTPCPCCETWCDDLDCQCDECEYNQADHDSWLAIIGPILAAADNPDKVVRWDIISTRLVYIKPCAITRFE